MKKRSSISNKMKNNCIRANCLPKIKTGVKKLKEGYLNKKTDGFFFKWSVNTQLFRNTMSL